MSYKVLFLENEVFYENMFDSLFFDQCTLDFDGGKYWNNIEYLRKYDLVVYTIFSSPLYNFIIKNCIINDIPTLLLFDGICEFSNFTKNKLMRKLSIENYHPIIADSVAVVGDEALEYFKVYNCKVYKYLPPRVFNMSEKLPLPHHNSSFDFLITTANTAYYDDEERRNLIELISKLVKELERSDFSYCFRLFDESLISSLGVPKSLNFTDGDFDTILKNVRSVITTPSSILLASMFHERAVGLLSYRDSPMFIQSGWLIHLGVNIEETLNSMHIREPKRMAFQSAQVKSNIETSFLSKVECNNKVLNVERKELVEFINQNMSNMLASPFNFNVEHRLRSIYWSVKASRFFRIFMPIVNFLRR